MLNDKHVVVMVFSILFLMAFVSNAMADATLFTGDSSWGPVTFRTDGQHISGEWDQGSGKIGQFSNGIYDNTTRVLKIHWYQPWNGKEGWQTFTLSADERTLEGHPANGQGWDWTITRKTGNITTSNNSSGESSTGTSTNSQGQWKLAGRKIRWRQPQSLDQSVTYPADIPWGMTFPSSDAYRDSTFTGKEFEVTRTDRTDKTYASQTLMWSKPPSTLAPGEKYAFTLQSIGRGEAGGSVSVTSLSDENSLVGYQHSQDGQVVREFVTPAASEIATEEKVICVMLTGAASYFEYLYVYKWDSGSTSTRWQGQWTGSGYYVWKCDKCGYIWEPWCGLEWEWMHYMNDETWATCSCGGNTVYLGKK